MTDKEIKITTQVLLNESKTEEAVNFIFNAYQEEHPEARDIQLYRDKVRYKLKTELEDASQANKEKAKLLLYGFMTVIGHSEGETAFNLMLLLLHLMRKGQDAAIGEAIELIKLEKASNHLGLNGQPRPMA